MCQTLRLAPRKRRRCCGRTALAEDRARRRIPLGGGGLCVSDGAPHVAIVRTQLLGRLLLPAVYLYHGQGASLVLVGQFASLGVFGQNAPSIRI